MSIFDKYQDLSDPAFINAYTFDDCFTVRNEDGTGTILDLDVAVALIRAKGNVSTVAETLKKSRRVIDGYISRDLALTELKEDIYEAFLDEVEDKAKTATLAGDVGMMKFVLSTLGKKRGYVPRVEATGKNGKDLNVMFYLPENGRDAPGDADAAD